MSFEAPAGLMVSVSGVRGKVGDAMDPVVATRFAAAYGSWLRTVVQGRRPRVILGRDSRTSGPLLARAVSAALEGVGCDVISLGLVPTPTALLAIRHHAADGGVVVTASHNPVEWNALKLASGEGMFLDAEQAAAMRQHLERPAWQPWDRIGGFETDDGAIDRHVRAVLDLPYLDVEALRDRAFRVALDCVRGAGALTFPPLLEALGCRIEAIGTEADGRFPRKPEPVAGNLEELEALVRDTGADIGLATDPDADRLSLIDETGRAIGEDYTLALAARLVLRHRSGPVVTNLSTSRVVEDAALEAGASFHRAPVGEINVARRMQLEGAVVGGEGNGGVILPDIHLTRDAQAAAALVLQLLLETDSTVSEIVASGPAYAIVKDSVPRPDGDLGPAYDRLEARLSAEVADRQDGLWLGWPDAGRWLHFRPSGTEPIVRMIAEAPDEGGARELVAAARRALDAS
jgi:phosphomannomutase